MVDVKEVNKVMDLMKESANLGKFVFGNVMKSVVEIAGLGGFVKAFIVFTPVKPDPIVAKLKELEGKIDGIASKMSHHFNEMKFFMTELNFYVEVVTPTSKLTKFMLDCLNNPTKNAKENFEKEYNKQTPLSIAYTLIGYLEQKSTNPLTMAMNADRLKTKATFEKWQGIINGVLGQFLFLEAFASGLLKEKNQYDANQLMKRSNTLLGEIEKWKRDYERTAHYWPGLKEYLDEFAISNRRMSEEKMADELKRTLETILTNDSMRLFVSRYDEHISGGYYAKYSNIVMMKLVPSTWGFLSNRNDGFVIVILRSTNGTDLSAEKYAEARKKVTQAHRDGIFSWSPSYETISKKIFDQCFPEADVVFSVPGYVFPEWRSVNWSRSDPGPGAIQMVEVDCPPCRGGMEVYVGLA